MTLKIEGAQISAYINDQLKLEATDPGLVSVTNFRVELKVGWAHAHFDNVSVESTGPDELETKIDIDPDTLNLKSKGKWVTVYIELSEGFDVEDIDIDTLELEGIPAEDSPTEIGDYDDDGIPDLMVKFDRKALIEHLEEMGVEDD